ncbi:hypothetical protein ACSBR2_017254 [Camellia fascicularis]
MFSLLCPNSPLSILKEVAPLRTHIGDLHKKIASTRFDQHGISSRKWQSLSPTLILNPDSISDLVIRICLEDLQDTVTQVCTSKVSQQFVAISSEILNGGFLYPEGLFEENKESIPKSNEGISKSITQVWHLNGRCPEGTIPIRRTKKKEILRASSIKSFGKKQHRTIPEPTMYTQPAPLNLSAHEHAIVTVQGDKYYGAKATMNVWKPIVQQSNEFSLSQLWVMAGSYPSDLNTVEAG